MPPTLENAQIEEALQRFVTAEGSERQEAARVFSALLKNAKTLRDSGVPVERDCPDDVIDCDEVVSPCCGATLANIFGTLPLQVECRNCGKKYFMGELIRNSIKAKKSSSKV